MADLWERLRAAQVRAQEASLLPPAVSSEEALPAPAPEGWTWAAPLVAHRCLSFALEARFWNAVAGSVDPGRWEGVLCLDTETTGLSGGAGTVAFLVGWAQLVRAPGDDQPPGVEVHQWFLRDHPGEPDLIEALDGPLCRAQALVTFNGASFDLPLLRSRWALTGRVFPEAPHRDDLHPSRRLWKRLLDTCRLGRLEETVLGLTRVDDVPGSVVPALWYDYLRRGAGPDFLTPLEGVIRHHAQDVYSLLCLDLLLAALGARPQDPRWKATFGPFPIRSAIARPALGGLLHPDLSSGTPVDFWGLVGLLDPPTADSRLQGAWEERREESVGLAWADRLKRRGDRGAVAVWRELWEARQSYPALEELLKWLEHRERDPGARAEAQGRIAEALKAPFLPRSWREALEHRQARLERKTGPLT